MKRIQELITRFLNDTLSTTKQIELFNLIESDERVKELYIAKSQEWIERYKESETEIKQREAALKKIREAIKTAHNVATNKSQTEYSPEPEHKRPKNWLGSKRDLWRVAAAAIMVLSFFLGRLSVNELPNFITGTLQSNKEHIVIKESKEGLAQQKGATKTGAQNIPAHQIIKTPERTARGTEVIVPKGSIIQMSLPDGSRVWINANSKLSYNSTFSSNNREIELEGEAYFEVAKEQANEFVVKSGSLSVIAKGTAFNIDASSKRIKTTLSSGRVVVMNSKGAKKTLQPDQTVTYHNVEGKFDQISYADASVLSSWREKSWIVRAMPMEVKIDSL